MKHGSLFSGIGGFDLAAEWMGWENVFHCEWNEFGKKVLNYYWPKSISYDDITKTDFTIHRGQIDVLSGGFPCQPYSSAGKRKGKEDERHLWPEMLRAIREIAPRWVIGENVFGLVNWSGGLVFDEVQSDLEAEGYEVFAVVLAAAAVNAPHRRDRIFFIAHANQRTKGPSGKSREANRSRGNNDAKQKERRSGAQQHIGCNNVSEDATNATRGSSEGECVNRQGEGQLRRCDCKDDVANASNKGLQRREDKRSVKSNGKKRNKQLTRLFQPNWENFPTQSPICSRDDGISNRLDGITFSKHRNESIKAYGNAVVPQVIYQLFKTIEEYENTV